MEKYEKSLLWHASQLDVMSQGYGEFTKYATAIVEERSDSALIALLQRIAEILSERKDESTTLKLAAIVKDDVISYYGYMRVNEVCDKNAESDDDERSLEELLVELEELVGLNDVKRKVRELIAYQKVQRLRRKHNLYVATATMHLAFLGNPGTGKTTVARLIGRIYKHLGLLSKGHFLEVSRTDLIAGYQGQTALKVKKVIERAKGGVLFIDEAYSITENENGDSYGRECLTELTKALEDYRDDLVVIVAGYTKPMEQFFASNPGLKSRFNTFLLFEDYNGVELYTIFKMMCEKTDYFLSEETRAWAQDYFSKVTEKKPANFANGRFVRNLYEDFIMQHALRVGEIEAPNKDELRLLTNGYSF